MKAGKFFSIWSLMVLLLVIVIIAGGVIIAQKSGGSQPVEITLVPEQEIAGQIFIGGEVNNPGYYPIFVGDNLEDIIQAAGGLKAGADFHDVELIINATYERDTPQKIDINRAEAWLLEALPGVGGVKAQAIIDYRARNGLFSDINELRLVPGFGDVSFDEVKDFITVND